MLWPSQEPHAMTTHRFTAELWLWDARRADTWVFVTLPDLVSTAVFDEADEQGPRNGFGSVRVQVRLGSTVWRTSVFPDAATGCFVLPVKKAVRRVEGIDVGDEVEVEVELI